MRYVALVHKEPGSVYGVTVPDVPGCFSAGETLDEAIRNASEALAVHLEGATPPAPRTIDAIVTDPAMAETLQDALIAAVEMGSQVEIPLDETLADAIDRAASQAGLSRAAFVERAVREALEAG